MYGGKEFTERRAADARLRFSSAADVGKFVGGIVVVILGAFMIADSIVVAAGASSGVFFSGVDRAFEFAVGFIALVLGAAQMPARRAANA